MDVILMHGLWLDGSSWDAVVPVLERAGHRTHALTLPGMESRSADRSGVTLRDHIDVVAALIDELTGGGSEVALVAHSRSGAVAHAAVDARPGRVAHVVYVASEPVPDGCAGPDSFPEVDGEVPLPDPSFFDEGELDGFDSAGLATFYERAIPSPVRVVRDTQHLADERRWDVPITVIACEHTGAMYRGWVEQGHPGAAELGRIREVEYVDLPTGHWPQLTRPEDLGRAIVSAIGPA
jgi:pimeloyl-ACP methyl ester carboxylesterase